MTADPMDRIVETVNLQNFADALELEILYRGSETLTFSTININRPGIQLTGFFEHFAFERVQLMGEMEFSYLSHFDSKTRMEKLDRFFAYKIPCLIISTGLDPLPETLICAEKYHCPLFRSKYRTTIISNKVINYLSELLAPFVSTHGVLVDLYGVGVLITGKSGIGKSETALELIQRGHRLVADDAVVIRKVNERLIGSAPEKIRYFMEVRGIGIIDVRSMYGVGAIKNDKVIDMVVQLENWDDCKPYDRLGLTQEYTEILDHKLPIITLPIRPGRNLAVILEVAARNQRLKSMGYFSAEVLSNKLIQGDH